MPVLAAGFEQGTIAFYEAAGWVFSGSPDIVSGTDAMGPVVHAPDSGRGGRFALSNNGNTDSPRLGNRDTNRWAHFWMRPVSDASSADIIVGFTVASEALIQASVVVQSDSNGARVLINRSTGTNVATSSGTIDNSVGHWFEIEMNCQNSPDGFCNVYVDGVLFVSASSVDLRTTGLDGWDQIRWETGDHIIDDVIVTDSTEGRLSGEFFGVRLPITGNDSVALSPSSGTNWENVLDEDTASYNESTSSGEEDLYTTEFNTFASSVYGVNVSAQVARSGTGSIGNNLQLSARSGNTTGNSSTVTLAASQYTFEADFFENNPDTATSWTEDDLQDVSVGVKTS